MRLNEGLLILLLQDLEGHEPVDLSGYNEETLLYHKAILLERKLAKGKLLRGDDQIKAVHLSELTFEGHQALAVAQLNGQKEPQLLGNLYSATTQQLQSLENITEDQTELIGWIAQKVQSRQLASEFLITWSTGSALIGRYEEVLPPSLTESNFRILNNAGLLIMTPVDSQSFICGITRVGLEVGKMVNQVQGQPIGSTAAIAGHVILSEKHRLVQFINDKLTLDDLEWLCFDIDIDFDNLAGKTKKRKVQELVKYLSSRERLPALHEWLRKEFGHAYDVAFH